MKGGAGDAALVRRAALRLGLQAAAGTLVVIALMITVLGVLLVRMAAADDETRLAVTAGNADDVTDPPNGMWIVLLRGKGTATASRGLPAGLPLTAALDRVAAGGPPEDTTITLAGHDYRVRTQAQSGPLASQVQVVLDEAPAEAQRAALLRSLCGAGLVGLLLTAAVSVGLGRRAVQPLQTALAVQRRFVADAGHELRTPLTLLSTRAQMLRRKLPRQSAAQEDLAPDVDAVVTDARRLGAILDDLLLAADPRSSTDNTLVDLAEVVTSVIDAAIVGATDAGVTVTLTTACPTPVWGTHAGLHRAVTAVVDNAVRHAATRVTAAVRTVGRRAVVEIADDGLGIDAALLPRVFERFATAAGERPGVTRRYGIGLALVSDVVTRHGGTVDARNQPHGGAVFTLSLPCAAKEPPKIARHHRH
ncbi:MAG: HAMP domain-containing histidine kinase [Pseudonocardia sp.]|nr:HAMP domain-containing histidine kinase [Pseudonocardia sp.]